MTTHFLLSVNITLKNLFRLQDTLSQQNQLISNQTN